MYRLRSGEGSVSFSGHVSDLQQIPLHSKVRLVILCTGTLFIS
jgi:hypothetical protein